MCSSSPRAPTGATRATPWRSTPGWFDRSPCGTGTSARMAQPHTRGELPLHTDFVNEFFVGTRFVGRLLDTAEIGPLPGVVPEFSGRAWITGTANYLLDPSDPFPHGFVLQEVHGKKPCRPTRSRTLPPRVFGPAAGGGVPVRRPPGDGPGAAGSPSVRSEGTGHISSPPEAVTTWTPPGPAAPARPGSHGGQLTIRWAGAGRRCAPWTWTGRGGRGTRRSSRRP